MTAQQRNEPPLSTLLYNPASSLGDEKAPASLSFCCVSNEVFSDCCFAMKNALVPLCSLRGDDKDES